MNLKFWKKRRVEIEKMSFQETLDLTGVPVITFRQGNKKFNFMLDTGANYCVINAPMLKEFAHTEREETAETYGMEGKAVAVRFVNAQFSYKNNVYEDIFQVLDMSQAFENIKKESGVFLHGIIGNNFMQKYSYVLDFAEMVAYSKR